MSFLFKKFYLHIIYLQIIDIQYMYKQDLALNNLQESIYHETISLSFF